MAGLLQKAEAVRRKPQSIASWLQSNRWDSRERAQRYKDHVVGVGWQEPYDEVVYDAQSHGAETIKSLRPVRGFKRETSINAIDKGDVENQTWPIDFGPAYTNKSWRTRLNGKPYNKWKSPATPMITNIQANASKGLMRVTFGSNGAVVQYDHVPRAVIAELAYCAKSGQSLGKLFWDIVRYRGKGGVEGGKYPYYPEPGVKSAKQIYAEGLTQKEKDDLDVKAFNAFFQYREGSEERRLLSAAELQQYVIALEKAYNDEDYKRMAEIYNKGLAAGFYEEI